MTENTYITQIFNPFTLNIDNENYLQQLLPVLVGVLFTVGLLYFFFVFLLGAISYINSGGDKAKLEQSRGKLLNALIGLVLLVSTFAIISLLERIFSFNILKFTVPTI